MIGPALAGVLTALAGPAVVIAADAGTWAVLAISYARVMPLVAPSMPSLPSALVIRMELWWREGRRRGRVLRGSSRTRRRRARCRRHCARPATALRRAR